MAIAALNLGDLLVFFTSCEKVYIGGELSTIHSQLHVKNAKDSLTGIAGTVLGFDPPLSLHFTGKNSHPTASTGVHELVLPTKYHEDLTRP